MTTDDGTWQTKAEIPEKERYGRYLTSREWAIKKRAVKKRSGGTCERCRINPSDAVHHLTYERKYAELLEDLQDTCEACHKFTHGLSDEDPRSTGLEKSRGEMLKALRAALNTCDALGEDGKKLYRLLQLTYLKVMTRKYDPSVVIVPTDAECLACHSKRILIGTFVFGNDVPSIWCRHCLYLQLHEIEGPDDEEVNDDGPKIYGAIPGP